MFRIKLKELREKHGLSQYELADNLGIKQSTVGMWENGTNNPRHATLIKIANYFNVSVDELTADGNIKPNGIKIPVLGCVQAGIPVEAIEDIIDYEEITQEMANTGEFFGLMIKGNSMNPRMQEGDVVIVRKQPDIESGEIAIVSVGADEATCKQVKKHETGISLVSLNTAYEPMFFTNDEIISKPISIIGKVVELRAKF